MGTPVPDDDLPSGQAVPDSDLPDSHKAQASGSPATWSDMDQWSTQKRQQAYDAMKPFMPTSAWDIAKDAAEAIPGTAEAALSLGSGMASGTLSAGARLLDRITGQPGRMDSDTKTIDDALHYEPRTTVGKAQVAAANALMSPATEVVHGDVSALTDPETASTLGDIAQVAPVGVGLARAALGGASEAMGAARAARAANQAGPSLEEAVARRGGTADGSPVPPTSGSGAPPEPPAPPAGGGAPPQPPTPPGIDQSQAPVPSPPPRNPGGGNGGTANPTAVQNYALASRLGIRLTGGQAADDVDALREEINNGDAIPGYHQQNETNRGILRQDVHDLRNSVAPNAADTNYGIGQEQIQHYQDLHEARRERIDSEYEYGRSHVSPDTPMMDSASLQQAIGNATQWHPQDSGVVGGVLGRLSRMDGPLSVGDVENLRTHLATVAREGQGSDRAAAADMRNVVETHPTLPQAGNIRDIFGDARRLAAQDFQDQRDDPAYAAVVRGQADPANFMDRYTQSPDGVQAMRSTLAGNQEASDNISAHLIDKVAEAGRLRITDRGGVAPSGVDKRMARTQAAMAEALPADAVQRMRDIQEGARLVTPDPRRVGASTSNSQSPLISALVGGVRTFVDRLPIAGAATDAIQTVRGTMSRQALYNRTMGQHAGLDIRPREQPAPSNYQGPGPRPAEPAPEMPGRRPFEPGPEPTPEPQGPPPSRAAGTMGEEGPVDPNAAVAGTKAGDIVPKSERQEKGSASERRSAMQQMLDRFTGKNKAKAQAEAKQGGSAKSIAERIAAAREPKPSLAEGLGNEALGRYVQDSGIAKASDRAKMQSQWARQAARAEGRPETGAEDWAKSQVQARGLKAAHAKGDVVPSIDAAQYEGVPDGARGVVTRPAVLGKDGSVALRGEAEPAAAKASPTKVTHTQQGDSHYFQTDAGHLKAVADDDFLHVKKSFLDPDARGQGHGSAMYDAALEKARDLGVGLASDGVVTRDAMKMWQRFKAQGYNVKEHPAVKLAGSEGVNTGPKNQPAYRINPEDMDEYKAPDGSRAAAAPLSYEKMIADAQRNKAINTAFAGQFYDKPGTFTSSHMLSNIMDVGKSDPRISAIAKVLHAVLPEMKVRTAGTPTVNVRGFDALGYYDPNSHMITLAKDAPVQTVLHEMVHAATSKWLDANPNHAITKDLDQLRQHVLDNLNPRIKEARSLTYGLTDVHELLAEAFTNSNFQKLMDNMSYKKTTAWGHLVNRVGTMLGIVRKSTGSTGVEYSALEHVMRATNEIMKQQRKMASGGAQAAVDTLRSPSTQS